MSEDEEDTYIEMPKTPEIAAAYELRLADDPGNLAVREALLGYYARAGFRSDAALPDLARHVFWIIENAPDADIAGSPFMSFAGREQEEAFAGEAERRWREQIKAHPENAAVWGHAAHLLLFRRIQEKDKSEVIEWLERAEALASTDYRWPEKLGQVYSLQQYSKDAGARVEAGRKSAACYERAYALLGESPPHLMKELKRPVLLQDIAINALVAEDYAKAADYAMRLLSVSLPLGEEETKSNWNDGNILHWSHIVLGKVAMQEGDRGSAKTHLLAAGETTGSPQLNSFGPDLDLAKTLLDADEKETVIAYLQACSKFWKSMTEILAQWIAAIEQGKKPNFAKCSHEMDA